MVEPIMYLAIGFLISMLCGLMVMPLVHHRAVRLTKRRLEAATPLSMAEIQADKDQLRAEFAMSARRLEMSVEQLKNKTTSQLAEIGKKSDAINRMKLELGEKNANIFTLEARESLLKETLASTETSLTAQVEDLKQRLGHTEQELADTRHQLELQRGESETATRELTESRARVENLSQRVTDLDQQLTIQVREAEQLGNRASELENQLSTQTKTLAERDFETSQLRQASEAAELIARDLRVELAALNGSDGSITFDKLRAEKDVVESELAAARDERGKLQRDLNAIHQQAESAWATERTENGLLRERINDIAAEVAKLAMTLEGPNSTIEAILAAEPAAPPRTAANDAGFAPNSTLADRIRALQSHPSRASQPG